MSQLLKFFRGNAKLGKHIHTFSLPSGFTCPGALECLSKSNRETGKITDGKSTQFRCFSASQETQYPNVRAARWHNFDLLRGKTQDEMFDLLHKSILTLKNLTIIRVHVAGDFFSQDYFNAWTRIAAAHHTTKFYAYTKSLPYWVNLLKYLGNGHKNAYFNNNLVLTASRGGRYDNLIQEFKLRTAEVVFSEAEAKAKKLEIDHDDSHAQKFGKNFALILHGTQPKGTVAAKALSKLKANGFNGYSRKPLPMIEA